MNRFRMPRVARTSLILACWSGCWGLVCGSLGLVVLWGLHGQITSRFPMTGWSESVITVLLGIAVASLLLWFAFRFLSDALVTIKDFWLPPVTTIGSVSAKAILEGEFGSFYLTVGSERFEVSAAQYHAVQEGDQVCVAYWPSSRIVANLERLERRKGTGVEQQPRAEQSPQAAASRYLECAVAYDEKGEYDQSIANYN
ncbi:MAG: hypothetical protein ACRD2L_18730, partial [Terriglobia bacterium]